MHSVRNVTRFVGDISDRDVVEEPLFAESSFKAGELRHFVPQLK